MQPHCWPCQRHNTPGYRESLSPTSRQWYCFKLVFFEAEVKYQKTNKGEDCGVHVTDSHFKKVDMPCVMN
jgi:hypothetical protein